MRIPLLAGLVLLASCSPAVDDGTPAEPDGKLAAAPEGQIPLKEFMGHVMERNAEELWAWSAYIDDERGPHHTGPKDEKQWIAAESDGLTMVEIGYLLDSPGLAIDDPDWNSRVAAFHAAAKASSDAAEKHDFAALENAGIALDRACVECHRTYKPEIEPPDPT